MDEFSSRLLDQLACVYAEAALNAFMARVEPNAESVLLCSQTENMEGDVDILNSNAEDRG